MISRELPSMAVIGLSVFGSARCETISLPPRFATSVADRELHPEHTASVAHMVTVVRHLTALDIFPVFVTKIKSDSGSSLREHFRSQDLVEFRLPCRPSGIALIVRQYGIVRKKYWYQSKGREEHPPVRL